MNDIIGPNDYLITPVKQNETPVSLQELIINTITDIIENSDKRSSHRELLILSCYSDREIDFYKSFFKALFKKLSNTPLTSVKIIFDTFSVTRIDYIKLQHHFKTDLYKGCNFEIRSCTEPGLLHAKSIGLSFSGSKNKAALFCTSANFTCNAFSERNKEFIFRSDSQKASNNFLKVFFKIWNAKSSPVKCLGENVKLESVNSYLLKGKFLRDAESTDIPFNNSYTIEFETLNENLIFKEVNRTLQVKEDANKKTVHFDRLILNCILNGQAYSEINQLRSRFPILPLFSRCYNTYWITADTYNRLEENIDFIEEKEAYNSVVILFRNVLQYKDYIISLISEFIITEQVFSVLKKRKINGIEITREKLILEIYNHVFRIFQKENSMNWSQYFGFDILNCYFADARGEVNEEIRSELIKGFQKPVQETFYYLLNNKQTVYRIDCEDFNAKLFKEMNKKLDERRQRGHIGLKKIRELLEIKYDLLSNENTF